MRSAANSRGYNQQKDTGECGRQTEDGSDRGPVFSFRWFVHDFSTEDSAAAAAASSCPQSGADCKPVVGSGSAAAEGEARPSTPQRQASSASKSNIPATNSGINSSGATRASGKHRSASCSFCIWLLQSLIHILQLGQIWSPQSACAGKTAPLPPKPRLPAFRLFTVTLEVHGAGYTVRRNTVVQPDFVLSCVSSQVRTGASTVQQRLSESVLRDNELASGQWTKELDFCSSRTDLDARA
ncbi:hypothetical protein CB1_001437043 [Camelus ferus]|nr:hypothetical protein CB1_001437043 [Camelus ferus]